MVKNKQTKKALLSSVLALLLCCSMLIGTTFAWFTDSVTSGRNTIQAGNLDVVLEYWDGDSYEEVTSNTKLFNDAALWEPGHTEVAYLKVSNAGSLALKYQLAVNVYNEILGQTKGGDEIKLSDYLVFSVVDKQLDSADDMFTREDARKAAGDTWGLKSYNSGTKTLQPKNATNAADKEDYIALIIYMPEAVDNRANHDGVHVPSIEMGVTLVATQVEAESDSFGTDYDEDAWADGFAVYSAQDLQDAINNGETNITVMENIEVTDGPIVIPTATTTFSMRANPVYTVINLNGKSITTKDPTAIYAFNNLGNLMIVDTVGTGSVNARGIYNGYGNGGENVTTANLIIDGGIFNAMGTNGGAAVYNYGNVEIRSGKFASNGGYGLNNQGGVMIVTNAEVKGGIYNTGDLTVENSTVYQHLSGKHCVYNWTGTVEINSGSFDSISGNELILVDGTNASVVINGGTYNKTAKSWLFGAATGKNISFVINNGTFNGYVNLPENTVDTIRPFGDPIVVNGGTFNFDPTRWAAEGYKAIDNQNGTWVVLPGNNTVLVADGLYFDNADTYYITNANGLAAVAAEVNKVDEYVANLFDGKTVKLMNDIDLGGAEWTPIGNFGNTSKQFTGTFDGQGYVISNFKITQKTPDRPGKDRSPHGFFGNLNGTVKNLTLKNATLDVKNAKWAGALVGRMNGGTIENCHVIDSSVTIYHWQVGGLVGQINNGAVRGCTVVNTTVSGYAQVGGIVGVMLQSGDRVIENCAVKNSALVQNGTFGEYYDPMFGGIVGALYSGDLNVNINGCVIENTNIKGKDSTAVYGYIEDGDSLTIDGVQLILTAADLETAVKAGGKVVLGKDIALSKSIAISNADFELIGNGYTITMTSDAINTHALFDITGGKASFQNVVFDGIKEGAVIRTVGVEFSANNVTAKNGQHTQQQGLFRLLGKSTIENCTFENNTCNMVITLNYDGSNNDPQVVRNCVFESNTCNSTAVLYYVKGAGCTVDGNKFLDNEVTTNGNGATVYMGFTENDVITNNLFEGNTVYAGDSKRAAGALMIGYAAEITGNAFVDNQVIGEKAKGNDVCASVYYTDIDLSGNYWGGGAPVENDDYFVEYPDSHKVIINSYLTSYGE